MPRNFTEIFYGPEGTCWALVAPGGSPEEGTTQQGARRPRRALVGSAHLVCPRTASLLYKYPQKYQNPRSVDEIFIQPRQSLEPPDPI